MEWNCTGCGRHYNMSVNECPYCRYQATITTGGALPIKVENAQGPCKHCEGDPGISTMLRWNWNYCPECGKIINK